MVKRSGYNTVNQLLKCSCFKGVLLELKLVFDSNYVYCVHRQHYNMQWKQTKRHCIYLRKINDKLKQKHHLLTVRCQVVSLPSRSRHSFQFWDFELFTNNNCNKNRVSMLSAEVVYFSSELSCYYSHKPEEKTWCAYSTKGTECIADVLELQCAALVLTLISPPLCCGV